MVNDGIASYPDSRDHNNNEIISSLDNLACLLLETGCLTTWTMSLCQLQKPDMQTKYRDVRNKDFPRELNHPENNLFFISFEMRSSHQKDIPMTRLFS